MWYASCIVSAGYVTIPSPFGGKTDFMNIRFSHMWVRIGLFFLLTFPVYAQLSNLSIAPADTRAGEISAYTISFKCTQTLPAAGKIVITFPAGFDVNQSSAASSSTIDGSFTVTNNGSTTVTITRAGGTDRAPGVQETIQLFNVRNHQTAGTHNIQITTQNGSSVTLDSGTKSVTIASSDLYQFSISAISANQTAGNPINLDIDAQDEFGNTVTSFTGSATLSDATGSISPTQTTNFSSGHWNNNVVISKTSTSNTIYVLANGKSGSSNSFSVGPTLLKSFRFDPVSSPQTAGSYFNISITALDTLDNVKTDYASTATLTEKTGTLVVKLTGNSTTPAFTAGTWTGEVQMTRADQDIQILSTGGGKTGTSGYFNVEPAGVTQFFFTSVSTQKAGQYFPITLFAMDSYLNIVTDYTGTVNISHTGSGTIQPAVSGSFINGIGRENVQISTVQNADQIKVQNSSGKSGQSNAFNIVASPVDHYYFNSISSSQTAGSPFSVTIIAKDINNNPVDTFNETITLQDETGTFSQSITFSNGSWTGNVTVTETKTNNALTATGVGKSTKSSLFNVQAASADHFEISTIPSPKTAGSAFTVTLTALDAYDNVAKSFAGTVNISAGSITVSPTVSASFVQGVLASQSITITEASNDISLTINDGSGHTGHSNYFNVKHNVLTGFDISSVSDQATGQLFKITVTARDAFGNRVTSFDGSGNTVNITHNGSASVIDPDVSGPFQSGVWTGNIEITQTMTNDQIKVTRTGGSQNGTSNIFNVIPSSVDQFSISAISPTQTAGQGFSVTITAEDKNGNRVTSFNSTATLTDKTGSVSPGQITFSSGIWTGTIQMTKSLQSNAVTVTSVGRSETSNTFNVNPAAVNSFVVAHIASPASAGTAFPVSVQAVDQYGNVATQFQNVVSLSDPTGTLSPGVSANFVLGVLTNQMVTIDKASQDLVMTVDDHSGHVGLSNTFNVEPGDLDRFVIETIDGRVNGDPFTLTIQAMDVNDNKVTDFSGTVDLSDETGTIQPNVSGHFVNGQWSGGVTIYDEREDNQIHVSQTGVIVSPPSGHSNLFDVITAPGIVIREIKALSGDLQTPLNTITTDQTNDWYLRVKVENQGSSDLVLDSVRVQCLVNGNAQSDYTLQYSDQFLNSDDDTLRGVTSDTLLIRMDVTGHVSGSGVFRSYLYFKNVDNGSKVKADTITYVAVQTPAVVSILRLNPSQEQVSGGQSQSWRIYAVLSNSGMSAVEIDSSALATALSFSIGENWKILKPPTFQDGDWMITGGDIDTLEYEVSHTGSGEYGYCEIHFKTRAIEINTDRVIDENTDDFGSATIEIEEPAGLRINSVVCTAPNLPYLNTSQPFSVEVELENVGGDAIQSLDVQMTTDGSSSFFTMVKSIDVLAGGQKSKLTFNGTTSSSPDNLERFTAEAFGYAENTIEYLYSESNIDDTEEIIIQTPAVLQAVQVLPSETHVRGGQADPWKVRVVVRNAGQSSINLQKPAAEDLVFSYQEIPIADYSVIAPSKLSLSGGIILAGNTTDTLTYQITSTGRLGGTVSIKTTIRGTDANNAAHALEVSGTSSIVVEDSKEFRLISTQIIANNITDAGNAYVDYNQPFQVLAIVRNGLSQRLSNIEVRLRHNYTSVVEDTIDSISSLEPSEIDTARFSVTAMSQSASPESFYALIHSAYNVNTGKSAIIGPADDSTAYATIQKPAHIVLSSTIDPEDGIVARNQTFYVTTVLKNEGESSLKTTGKARIVMPGAGYEVRNPDDLVSLPVDIPVTWELKAPPDAKTQNQIRVTLEEIPVNKNTGALCSVELQSIYLDVTTISSQLQTSITVHSPEGAMDSVVSTGQTFVLKTLSTWQNATDVKVRLTLPRGYVTQDTLEKSISGSGDSGYLYWQIQAPSYETLIDTFIVSTTGKDALNPANSLIGLPRSIILSTIKKSDLSLELRITEPAETVQKNTVTLGQEFTLRASLINSGAADIVGSAVVAMSTLPTGYTTSDALEKTLENGAATWKITAAQPNNSPGTFRINWVTIPKDENTGETASVRPSNPSVAVTQVGSWLSLSQRADTSGQTGTVVPGQQNVPLLTLNLKNIGLGGDHNILISHIQIYIEDLDGGEITPLDVLDRIRVVNGNDTNRVYGIQSQLGESNPVGIQLQNVLIAVDSTVTLQIQGSFRQESDLPYVRMSLKSASDLSALDASTLQPITIRDPSNNEIEPIISDPRKIYNPETEASLWNCPNPFGGPGEEETVITYYLSENADISFRVFTLIGELVWSREFTAQDSEGGTGAHEITWNGTNDKGFSVINGVYILVMQTSTGFVGHTKIAVAR